MFSESLLAAVGDWPGIEEVHAPQGLPPARYNIAPTQPIAVVRVQESVARVEPARWGLIPHWKKDLDGPPLFNARAETVATKPSFRESHAIAASFRWMATTNGKLTYQAQAVEPKSRAKRRPITSPAQRACSLPLGCGPRAKTGFQPR